MSIHCRTLQLIAVLGVWLTVFADASTNFGIYLTDKPIDVTSPTSPGTADLSGIALQDKPILTESDVESYNPTNGVMVFKDEAMSRIRALFENDDPQAQQPSYRPPMTGRTFVVVAGGDRIFLGALWSIYSSYGGPSVPVLHLEAHGMMASHYPSPAWSDSRIAASLRVFEIKGPKE
jgi:hypothetical protein